MTLSLGNNDKDIEMVDRGADPWLVYSRVFIIARKSLAGLSSPHQVVKL
jgi:hypothetical protein